MPIYEFDTVILRTPGRSVIHGLRTVSGGDPSYEGVVAEHKAYASALAEAGANVVLLPPLEAFPDSIFVEDPALVFQSHAILLRPGAESRRGEPEGIALALQEHFDTVHALPGAGFADGGDILQTPEKIMIGLSERTDEKGARALQELLLKIGLKNEVVKTPDGVLHFKSDCALIDDETILSTARLAASNVFEGFDVIETPAGEEGAANALRVNDVVFLADGYPRVAELLDSRNYRVVPLKTSEIAKIDAGLSCMSLRRQA